MKHILCKFVPFLLAFLEVEGFDTAGNLSPDQKNFLEKYATIKLYESCYGIKTFQLVSDSNIYNKGLGQNVLTQVIKFKF